MVAEAEQVELQRLGFDDPFARHIIQHQMGKIRLAGHRADRCELRHGESAPDSCRAGLRIGDPLQNLWVRDDRECVAVAAEGSESFDLLSCSWRTAFSSLGAKAQRSRCDEFFCGCQRSQRQQASAVRCVPPHQRSMPLIGNLDSARQAQQVSGKGLS